MNKNQSNKPLFSIVIPSFNQGKFIEQAITSVLGQGYPNIELIVIDGGSNDQTLDILKKYDESINYYVSEPDNGQAHAINKGFRLAKGEILAWLNSDDMYLPCTFLKVARLFRVSREPKLLYGGCLHFQEGKTSAYGYLPLDFDADKLTYNDYIVQPSTFWSRALWETVGELNETYNYVLDWDWFIRASKICQFIPVQDYLSIYRIHENHKTGTGGIKRIEELLKIIESYADKEWISVHQDVYGQINSLRAGFKLLFKLRLYRFRHLFYPRLYLKYGHRVDVALSTI